MDNNNNLISSEEFEYDHAGNMTIGMDESVVYDTNNRIVEYQGTEVTYDADGNMLISPIGEFTYDSANRLTVADTTIYTYDVENIRVKKCIGESITEYTHNANSKLSQLLTKTENNVTTKYVYGLGLIGQEEDGVFKTYHYDYRGSTVALTNLQGGVTDTFQYDTYGKLTARTGTTATPFMYNGRDGVMTDENGLVYMRARYYSPTFKRFINADVVAGSITNAITLNRYAYANGNPVSYVDPSGRIGVLALIGIGAAIGFVSGAIGSLVSQSISSKINGEEVKINGLQVFADAMWGAVDGAISFSPLGAIGKVVSQGAISVGSSITDQLIEDGDVTFCETVSDVAIDYAFSWASFNFTYGKNISEASIATNNAIDALNNRENRKWANKQIKRLIEDFNQLFDFKIYEDSLNSVLDMVTDVPKQYIDNWLECESCSFVSEPANSTRK